MGEEMGSSRQSAASSQSGAASQAGASSQSGASSGQSQASGASSQSASSGGGPKSVPGGGPGRAAGGGVGPQQPLPGNKQDKLVRGSVNPRGEHLSRSFKGTPDPTKDRAAYYQVVPDQVRAAEASLNREEIPTGYKNQVRKYFDAIQPN